MKQNTMEPIRFLSKDDMHRIHKGALRILGSTGMKVNHTQALEYLLKVGCKVDMDLRMVKFPEEIVEKAIAKMKTNFADTNRWPKRMPVRYSQIGFENQPFCVHENFSVSSGGFCCFIQDLSGNRRKPNMEDAKHSIKLAHNLDEITYTGLPCAAQDVPIEYRAVAMAAELAKNTTKLGGIETLKKEDVGYICQIGEVVAGGKEAHRKNPILVGYAEARTPLCIDEVMADVMIAHLEIGLPQTLDTMPNAGVTAPITAAGALAIGIAETLGGLVLGFAVDPNATMSIDCTPGYCDMRSLLFKYAGAERAPLLSARIQMISEYYGCPSGVHGGKTDACVPGIQAGVEKSISMLSVVLAGAIGFGTVGQLENGLTYSPVQLVLDNEIARYIRRCVRGIEVNEHTLALDVIEKTGVGGGTFNMDHTLEGFKEELLLSPFFEALHWGVGNSLDSDRLVKMASEKASMLMAKENEPILSSEQEAEIDEILKEAKSNLSKT
jgi:trimethylamine---corrinoid protein Co-methyltransferase